MSNLDEDQLRRIGFLAKESLVEYWHRFAKERGMPPFTDADIAAMLAADAEAYPWIVKKERRK